MFARYGELDRTRRLAREIVHLRKLGRLETTSDLRILIEAVYKWRPQRGRIHLTGHWPLPYHFQCLMTKASTSGRPPWRIR